MDTAMDMAPSGDPARNLKPPNTPPLTCAFPYFPGSEPHRATPADIGSHPPTDPMPPQGAPMMHISGGCSGTRSVTEPPLSKSGFKDRLGIRPLIPLLQTLGDMPTDLGIPNVHKTSCEHRVVVDELSMNLEDVHALRALDRVPLRLALATLSRFRERQRYAALPWPK